MHFFRWLRQLTRRSSPIVLAIATLHAETLPELIALAFQRNGELQSLRTRTVEARALVEQTRLRPNPNLEVSYGNGPVFGSAGETDFTAGVSQNIEIGSKRLRRVSLAEAELREIEWQIADRERLLRSSIASVFADWLALSRNEANARRLLDLTRQGLALVPRPGRSLTISVWGSCAPRGLVHPPEGVVFGATSSSRHEFSYDCCRCRSTSPWRLG